MVINSKNLFARAKKVIPGGVNSPVRAFAAVGGTPRFMQSGIGATIIDVDRNEYYDYVGAFGPLILGHAHPIVCAKVVEAIHNGSCFGAPTIIEVEIAELISKLMPSIELLRMVNSGTEATLTAIRLARGVTGRKKIIKFAGCYHGHNDSLLVKAGSGLMTLGLPETKGILPELAAHTLVANYNDPEQITTLFNKYGNEIAGVIVEPIVGNMNLILPHSEFLPLLRDLCTQYKSILIFDEVMTGFRVALGGAQALYNITPDLTCLGKIIGGGYPIGALGGRQELMSELAPSGPIYQAGTMSGNPVALTAGLATLEILNKNPSCYQQLDHATKALTHCIQNSAKKSNIPISTEQVGGMFGFQFIDDPNHKLFKQFFHLALEEQLYFAPSAFETNFVSLAHDQQVIDKSCDKIATVFAKLNMI